MSDAGDSFSGEITAYHVHARVGNENFKLTNNLDTEEQATAVLDRIMAHKESNLDLTKAAVSREQMSS